MDRLFWNPKIAKYTEIEPEKARKIVYLLDKKGGFAPLGHPALMNKNNELSTVWVNSSKERRCDR